MESGCWHLQWLLVIEGHWEEHMFSSCYQQPLGNSWHYWWGLLKAASYDTSVLTKNLSLIQFFSECPPCQYLAFVRLASDGRQGRWGGLKKIARNTTIATKSLYYVSPRSAGGRDAKKSFGREHNSPSAEGLVLFWNLSARINER